MCKSWKRGRDLTRTDIEVGDDTMPFFVVSLWQKQMGSMVSAGDVVLLQNLKIAKYGNAVEARTVQWSSLLCLVHPYQSLLSKAVEELVTGCRVGTTTKDKLRRVIKWVQQSRSTICNIKLQSNQTQKIEHLPRNWTVLEEEKPRDCFSLMEVSQLTTSCKAIVCASIGEIVPLHTSRTLGDTKKEKVFISRRVCRTEDNELVDDLLCTGCQLCGSPLDSKFEQNAVPLICWKTSSRLHSICSIYRPFLLYVWDESDYMPILVKNRAAEILFGNIKAGKVYSAYKEQMNNQNLGPRNDKDAIGRLAIDPRLSGEGLPSTSTLEVGKSLQLQEKHLPDKLNYYRVWLILLKMLLKQGKNGPLKLEIIVDPSLDIENGKFELVSATMPCFGTK
ncbi:hypothetical protein AAZX31_14G152400 [Glycine max]|uniref:Uncharacterized protein n=2 Tax=Glycine subgen. Soja TaxID=1462606 RepID=A0A0R0GP53_SOYBN|nr:hypothetical protein glysoja_045029 [Glycine soja]KRH16571.1 hypothetical protein GLYMA_14G162900v4 [Glycine max]RZB69322.1 hypothetical protein D0Y65_038895 [Glycine soja]